MLHILLVDDDEDEHLFFQWSIEKIQAGIDLSCVFSRSQALGILQHKNVDMIFLDINLPGADGFDCLEEIKKEPSLNNIPVYMYSTEITENSLLRARSMGAAGCIKKSRNQDVLSLVIIEKLKLTDTDVRNKLQLK
jgi:CheY-like chemotaxis protein